MKALNPTQKVLFVISIVLMYFNRLFPAIEGLSELGNSTLWVFIGSLIMLVGVSRSWGIVLCMIAFPVSNVYTVGQMLQGTMGNATCNFMIFSTMMLYALRETGVLRRIAIMLISHPVTRKNPWFFIAALWAAALLVGSLINVTANVMLFTALTIEILEGLGFRKTDRFSLLVMLGTFFFCGFSYGVTPIGHPTALTTIALFEGLYPVSLLKYSLVGYIVAIPVYIIFVILMKYVYKLDAKVISSFDPTSLREGLGPMSKAEKYSLIIFSCVTLIWISPDVLKPISPALHGFVSRMGIYTPAALGAILMCLISIEDKPILDFYDGVRNGVEWNAVWLMYISLFLSSAVSRSDAGVSVWLGDLIGPVFSGMSSFMLVFVTGLLCTLLTNFMSCTLSVTIAATVPLALITSGTITNVNVPALCMVLGLVEAYAFMTPSAGTVAAVTAGFGWIPAKRMFRDGAVFSAIFGPITIVLAYYLATLIL